VAPGTSADAPQYVVMNVSKTCWHPEAGTHESVVQATWSSQSSAGPPAQVPVAEQVSAVVHALLSLQATPGVGV